MWSYINFYRKWKDLLSEESYIKKFLEKNSWYHSKDFIKKWRLFLLHLWTHPDTHFLYTHDYDEVCDFCDISTECKKKESKLHNIVYNLDQKYHNTLWLSEWKVYSIKEINNLFLKKN